MYEQGQRRSPISGYEEIEQRASLGQWCSLCGGWRGCLGLEPTVEMFVGHIVLVARELWRVLRDDGTFWLNFGDSYSGGGGYAPDAPSNQGGGMNRRAKEFESSKRRAAGNLKPKDLIGIPWRVAFALQADGWYLRSDIVWAKGVSFCSTYSGSCMPESVTDRPTKGHEYVFLLAKSKSYFYDAEAVKEGASQNTHSRGPEYHKLNKTQEPGLGIKDNESWSEATWGPVSSRNLRTVWLINPGSYAGAHFATFPPALVEPMIKAGTSERGCCPECGAPWERVTEKEAYTDRPSSRPLGTRGNQPSLTASTGGAQQGGRYCSSITLRWQPTCDCSEDRFSHDSGHYTTPFEPIPCTVLDPFGGSGTTAKVAIRLRRRVVLIELSKEYCDDHIIPRLSEPIQMELAL